ncbi:MAG: protein kinase [Parachlamydiales bacterium]|jgi:serine/threonine protein kinase
MGFVSGSSPTPHLVGSVIENGGKGKELTVTDSLGREIIHAEVLSAEELANKSYFGNYFDNVVEVEVLTISQTLDRELQETKQKLFLRVNTIQLGNSAFKDRLFPLLPGWTTFATFSKQDALFSEVMKIQSHQSLELSKAVFFKVTELEKLDIKVTPKNVATSLGNDLGGEWVLENNEKKTVALDKSQKLQLVTEIEQNKKEWLQEAEEKGSWIEKKVFIAGVGDVRIEIFPSNRQKVEKLGRIDVRFHFLGSGATKKAYSVLRYEKNRLGASTYVKLPVGAEDTLKKEIEISSEIQSHPKKARKHLSKHKSVATSIFEKAEGIKSKTKIDMTLYSGNLSGLLKFGISEKTRVKVTIQILQGLENLHAMGILHLDIKPDNIFVRIKNKRFEVTIADYDLSKHKNSIAPDSGEISIVGTNGYIAPEDLKTFYIGTHNPVPTERSDLYSVGITLRGTNDLNHWKSYPENREGARVIEKFQKDYERLVPEPKDRDSYDWGIWKLSHPDPSKRFSTAKEAKNFFRGLRSVKA